MSYDIDDEPICRLCGCTESEHDDYMGVCTGCGEDCEFEEEDDAPVLESKSFDDYFEEEFDDEEDEDDDFWEEPKHD